MWFIITAMNKRIIIAFSALFLLSACAPAAAMVVATYTPSPAPTETPQPTRTPFPTPEPSPYSLDALRARTYGQGKFTVDKLWYTYDLFDRYYIIYESDGLDIHGYVNVPKSEGPHPVVIALHGYIPPDEYQTLDYTTRYADDMAQAGFIVLHPNMRNFPPSDSPGRVRDSNTGYTVDVLNLMAYLRQGAGQEESIFKTADLDRIGIWGHSIGGSIALRTMSVESEAIKAAVLYAAVSQRYATVVDGDGIYDLSESDAPFSIHHGEVDEVISVYQSWDLCRQLTQLQKDVDCYFYEGQPHTFYRDTWADPLFTERTIEFFNENL